MSRRRGQAVDRRIRLLLAVLTLAFAATLGRAVWVQGVHAEPLARLAQGQQRERIDLPARRGTIYDRTGSLLALGERATTVYANPHEISEPRAVATIVAQELGVDPERLAVNLADRSKGFVYVARQADPARVARVSDKGLDGVGTYAEERRTYPQRSVASHVLGYAGVDNRGLAGLERSLDEVLAGRSGHETIVRDPFGRVIEVLSRQPERPGRDVHLTLDRTVQAQAESVLRETVTKWGARAASAIVLDPQTGEVLAMAVAPGYDANRFGAVPVDRTRNRAVTDVYEPGSTFKLVTVAGMLSEQPRHAVDGVHAAVPAPRRRPRSSTTRMRERPSGCRWRRSSRTPRTSGRSRSRTCSAATGSSAGSAASASVTRPGSTSPARARDRAPVGAWSGSTIGNVPIGQGIGVTPIQMASAYAAIANEGVAVQPHLVARVADGPRTVPKRRRVVSEGVAATLKTLLRGVVDEGGTGTAARDPRLLRGGQDRDGAEAGSGGRLLGHEVRGLVRRVRAGDEAAAGRARERGRAAGLDLGRRRRGAGVPADRPLRAPVPRSAAGRPARFRHGVVTVP